MHRLTEGYVCKQEAGRPSLEARPRPGPGLAAGTGQSPFRRLLGSVIHTSAVRSNARHPPSRVTMITVLCHHYDDHHHHYHQRLSSHELTRPWTGHGPGVPAASPPLRDVRQRLLSALLPGPRRAQSRRLVIVVLRCGGEQALHPPAHVVVPPPAVLPALQGQPGRTAPPRRAEDVSALSSEASE
jgi:hypothetical protein